jgi:hypothetical protein
MLSVSRQHRESDLTAWAECDPPPKPGFHLREEVVVGAAADGELGLLHEDLVELAALRTGVERTSARSTSTSRDPQDGQRIGSPLRDIGMRPLYRRA